MKIELLRNEIDAIDRDIVRLLEARNLKVLQIGALKNAAQIPVADPGREQEIIRTVRENTKVPATRKSVESVFHAIMRESRLIQENGVRNSL